MLRTYARTVALALAALALAGATVLGWRPATGFYHAGLAILFGYVGFLAPNHGALRQMVLGLRVLVVVTKTMMMVGFLVVFEHLAHDPIALTCYVVGAASVLAGVFLPDGHHGGA